MPSNSTRASSESAGRIVAGPGLYTAFKLIWGGFSMLFMVNFHISSLFHAFSCVN